MHPSVGSDTSKLRCWSTCSAPEIFKRDTQELPASRSIEHKIDSHFDKEHHIYEDFFLNLPHIAVGQRLNIFGLLGYSLDIILTSYYSSSMDVGIMASTSRTTKDRAEATLNINGKYIMICCVLVPSIWSSEDGCMVYHLVLASHELDKRDDLVLVIVLMMTKGFTCSYHAYNYFLSVFSCLAVRHSYTDERKYICSALGFNAKPNILILDPYGKVLYQGLPDMFLLFGGGEDGCFPITLEKPSIFSRGESLLENRSLNELLGLSNNGVLNNIEYHVSRGLEDDVVNENLEIAGSATISALKRKVAVICLCSNCRSLCKLAEVHKKCSNDSNDQVFMYIGWLVCYADPTKSAKM